MEILNDLSACFQVGITVDEFHIVGREGGDDIIFTADQTGNTGGWFGDKLVGDL